MNNKWLRIIIISSIVLVCILFDQISKSIAINNLIFLDSVPVIDNFFYWTLCYNTGGAWSLFSNATWALVIVSIMALGAIIYTLVKSKNKLYDIAASIFIGGLLGNLIDRIAKGKVTDFIDFIIFGYDFPVFNIADIFIVVSAILIGISVLKEDDKDGNKNSN